MNKTQMAIDVFDANAKLYQDKFMDVDLYAESLDLFCSKIKKPNASILELACGPGNVTRYLLKRRPDFSIVGTDLSVNMLELAKQNNPTATFQKMDCRDLHKIKERYDGIMCAFALPYVDKEEALKMIHDGAKILQPGGLFYISTMEDDYTKSGLEVNSVGDSVFMHYHQHDYLRNQLLSKGLKLLLEDKKEYIDSKGRLVCDLILIGQKASA